MIRNTHLLFYILMSLCFFQEQTLAQSQVVDIQVKAQIKALNQSLIQAAKDKDFSKIANLYTQDAILHAEYNPLIDGKAKIKEFYTEIFKRQSIKYYHKETTELFDFGETILELGDFKKTLVNDVNQEGKYWNYWKKLNDGKLILKSEAFGYYHHIDKPEELRVYSIKNENSTGLNMRNGALSPIELDAYASRNENSVRDRDTEKVLSSYTHDGVYYPFATPKKVGMAELTKHYYDYHKNPVKIDTIEVWTYDYEHVPGGIICHRRFYVEWTVPDFSGKTSGGGMVYFKRQEDNSLKIFRQIGLHIHE